MREHLPMVFSPLLDVNDYDLLDPEGELDEVVEFHGSINLSTGPSCPQPPQAHPMLVIVHNILCGISEYHVRVKKMNTMPSDQKAES